jgi:phosphotransacetylase
MRSPSEPTHLLQLIERAKKYPPISVAVVDAAEEHVLTGAHEACEAGLIKPVLIGDKPIAFGTIIPC